MFRCVPIESGEQCAFVHARPWFSGEKDVDPGFCVIALTFARGSHQKLKRLSIHRLGHHGPEEWLWPPAAFPFPEDTNSDHRTHQSTEEPPCSHGSSLVTGRERC